MPLPHVQEMQQFLRPHPVGGAHPLLTHNRGCCFKTSAADAPLTPTAGDAAVLCPHPVRGAQLQRQRRAAALAVQVSGRVAVARLWSRAVGRKCIVPQARGERCGAGVTLKGTCRLQLLDVLHMRAAAAGAWAARGLSTLPAAVGPTLSGCETSSNRAGQRRARASGAPARRRRSGPSASPAVRLGHEGHLAFCCACTATSAGKADAQTL